MKELGISLKKCDKCGIEKPDFQPTEENGPMLFYVSLNIRIGEKAKRLKFCRTCYNAFIYGYAGIILRASPQFEKEWRDFVWQK
jgi:hypothetical protein